MYTNIYYSFPLFYSFRQKCPPRYVKILEDKDMAEQINFVFKIAGPDFEQSTKIEFVPRHMIQTFPSTVVFDSDNK